MFSFMFAVFHLPLFGVITDFAAHALWYCDSVNAYYVATEEARRQLHRKGQPASPRPASL